MVQAETEKPFTRESAKAIKTTSKAAVSVESIATKSTITKASLKYSTSPTTTSATATALEVPAVGSATGIATQSGTPTYTSIPTETVETAEPTSDPVISQDQGKSKFVAPVAGSILGLGFLLLLGGFIFWYRRRARRKNLIIRHRDRQVRFETPESYEYPSPKKKIGWRHTMAIYEMEGSTTFPKPVGKQFKRSVEKPANEPAAYELSDTRKRYELSSDRIRGTTQFIQIKH